MALLSYLLATVIFLLWLFMWFLHVTAIFYGKSRLHKEVKRKRFPGVSILKPVLGADTNLYFNLETYFTMDYLLYEIWFSVAEKADPAVAVIKKLMAKYPKVPAQLLIGGSQVGVNPKINNINRAYEASNFDLILISDSGIKMKTDTLQDMVDHMDDDIGIVHQVPYTADRPGFAATLEQIYFGTAHSRLYLAFNCLPMNCNSGMSSLMRKSVLEGRGGLKAFGCYLAEDLYIGQFFRDSGWRTVICSRPALQNSGDVSVENFKLRLGRWTKLRIAYNPIVLLLEPLSECTIMGVCASWSLETLFHWDAMTVYLVHNLVWFACDYILISILQNGTLPFSKLQFLFGWLYREYYAPFQYVETLLDPDIRWRNKVFRVARGGMTHEVERKA